MRRWCAVSFLLLLTTIVGCGSGDGGEVVTAVTQPSAVLTVSASVEIPASSSSSLTLSGTKSAVSTAACTGGTATLYTLDGVQIATGEITSTGQVTLDASSYDLIRPSDVSTSSTSYSQDLILSSDCNGAPSETYLKVEITEGKTTSIDMGTSDPTTTLASQAMATEIEGYQGWGSNYRVAITKSGLDIENLYKAAKAIWEVSDLTGESNQASVGKIKGLITAFFAGGGKADQVGYTKPFEFIQAVLKGDLTSLETVASKAATTLGVDQSTFDDYSTFVTGFKQVKEVVREHFLDVADQFEDLTDLENTMKTLLVHDDPSKFNDPRAFTLLKGVLDQFEANGELYDAIKTGAMVEQYSGAWETACTGEDSCDSSSIEATYYSVVNGGINCGTSVSDCRDEFQHMKQTIDAKGLNYFKGSGGGFDTKIFEQVGAAIEAVAACSTCTFTASTLDQFIPTAATIGQASVQSCLDQAIRNRTDPRDCYTSGNSVAGGGGSSQTSSAFTTLLSGITNAGALSCDTSNCYYISNILSTTDGALCKVSLDGSSSSCLVTGLNKPKALSLTGTKACWVLFNTGTIYCISKTGGAITTVVTGTNEHLGMSNGFVNDGTNFYWGNAGEPMGQIYSVPVTTVNGDDTAISSGLSLTNLSTPLIRSDGLSGSTLFFDHTLVNGQFTRVSQISTSGGSPTLLATTSSQIQAIASDGTTFCWTEGSDTGSDRAASCKPVGGGTTTTYLSNSSASVGGLGLSGGFLYFSLLSSDGRSIMKCATSGSTCTTHASGLTGSLRWSNFVGDSMFFVESSGSQQTPGPSTIKKVAK